MIISKLLKAQLNHGPGDFVLPTWEFGEEVPKIIHQTFYSYNFPPSIANNVEKLKNLNPNWTYKFYSDDDIEKFIFKHYGQDVLDRFNKISPRYGAAKADLFRYLLLYKYGGVYLDIKSTLIRPLDDVLLANDRYLLSHWKNGVGEKYSGWGFYPDVQHVAGGEFQQWYIVAAAGHPFLKAVAECVLRNIEFYNPFIHGCGKLAVFRVTGPIAYTLAIAPILHKHPNRIVCSELDIGLIYSVCNGAENHQNFFKSHYATLLEPLVKSSHLVRSFAIGIGWFRRTVLDSWVKVKSLIKFIRYLVK